MSLFVNKSSFFISLIIIFNCILVYADSELIYNIDNGHYYQRFDQEMTWNEAASFCSAKRAHLATITSENENLFIYENFNTNDEKKCWIGATDSEKEGTWKWITGEEWDYTNWNNGEPNNSTGTDANGEDYIHLFWITAENGTWNDIIGSATVEYDDNTYKEVPLCEWESIEELTNCQSEYQKGYEAGKEFCSNSMYTQEQLDTAVQQAKIGLYSDEDVNMMINKILEWDVDNNGTIGLIEAIQALKNASGIKPIE